MKIALFLDAFPAISQTFIFNQLNALLADGHEIVIFPRQHSGETTLHPVVTRCHLLQKTHFPLKRGNALWAKACLYLRLFVLNLIHRKPVNRLKRAFRKYRSVSSWRRALVEAAPVIRHGGNFDILFAHFGPNGLRANWYREAGLVSGPLVTVFHGYDMTEYLQSRTGQLYAPLFESGELFLPISRFWQTRLGALGCPIDRIKVHHVGIDCEHFSFLARTLEPGEPVTLLSVARLVEKKGIEYALRALALLVAAGSRIRYRVIGNGPLLGSLDQLATELHLSDFVTFTGVKTSDEVADELRRAHVFLAPSVTSRSGDMEGIPTVLMEAMATGMPVISTLHSGIPELVEDGVSGRLVAERDVDALAGAIRDVIHDTADWTPMGTAGRRKVLQEFNIAKLSEQLEHYFGALCQEST